MSVYTSKLTAKSQTVIPRKVREKLNAKPGDMLRYTETTHGILLERLPTQADDDPFASFKEWAGAADEKAYADL